MITINYCDQLIDDGDGNGWAKDEESLECYSNYVVDKQIYRKNYIVDGLIK